MTPVLSRRRLLAGLIAAPLVRCWTPEPVPVGTNAQWLAAGARALRTWNDPGAREALAELAATFAEHEKQSLVLLRETEALLTPEFCASVERARERAGREAALRMGAPFRSEGADEDLEHVRRDRLGLGDHADRRARVGRDDRGIDGARLAQSADHGGKGVGVAHREFGERAHVRVVHQVSPCATTLAPGDGAFPGVQPGRAPS